MLNLSSSINPGSFLTLAIKGKYSPELQMSATALMFNVYPHSIGSLELDCFNCEIQQNGLGLFCFFVLGVT